jgi:hypothetical protein
MSMITDTSSQVTDLQLQEDDPPNPPLHIRALLGTLPDDMTGPERERWVAVLTSDGMTGWPGTCKRRNCKHAVSADGVCMTHWCGDWTHGRRRANALI